MTFERSEERPAGAKVPAGPKWAKSALRLRSVPRDGAWYCVDDSGGRTTNEQVARRANGALAYGSPWEHAYVEVGSVSQLWVRWIGPVLHDDGEDHG